LRPAVRTDMVHCCIDSKGILASGDVIASSSTPTAD
jgi:hypothetical protein